MGSGATTPASSRLRRLARQSRDEPRSAPELCDLCSAAIPADHRHLLDLESRELMCCCQACKVLFDRGAAGGGHYRLVPDRRLRLDGFELGDAGWEELRIPV